jgi:hypothetical protein
VGSVLQNESGSLRHVLWHTGSRIVAVIEELMVVVVVV